ncbi:outer membrane protein assembly factor BamA, partial [Desulfobacterales bacterium HSG17]|nr:outer membrane protein assembly factor BamA [Desulfobacterales bacterium HSG17]
MLKNLRLLFIVIICFILSTIFTSSIYALETVQVVVLPFEINAPDRRAYLKEQLPKVISTYLKQEGAKIIDSGILADASWKNKLKNSGGIRKFGIERGADYVIWGSLTRIGNTISIDASMISTLENKPPSAFFVEGKGVENLSITVKKLVRKFSLKLFTRERVAKIQVKGNKRIEADAVKRIIKTKEGDVFLAKSLSEDLKAVYKMGYFEDIRIESEESPKGKIITFNLKEKSSVRKIRFSGNKLYENDEINESLTVKTGSVLNIVRVQNNVSRIESLYKEKNYHNAKITYKIRPVDNNQADIEFIIDEGDKVRIKNIEFIGNNAYTSEDLKDLMKSSEKGFWSWLTSSGELNREDLEQDAARLTAYYQNSGYIEARVGEPKVEYKGNWIYITIKIDEGSRYRVGQVSIKGDLVKPEKELLENLKISNEQYYNREVVRTDILKLSDIYSDEGYAYVDIAPSIKRNPGVLTVDLAYVVKKGKKVYFEAIQISGNTKTREKVIRRQLMVYEKELYSGRLLKRSVRNLHRLDYFEDVKVNTSKGSGADQMILKIGLTEKPTGTFSFGGGYSSTENLFAMASITQRNLFGLGQVLQLKAEVGGSSTRFTTSFTEPWLFDIPLSAGFDLYNWERDYDTYDKDSLGGAVRFGYPVFDYTRAYLTYRYDIGDIGNITEDAAKEVKDLEGENITSSIAATLRYDSRDKAFSPTEGGNHSFTIEYAGIGGDIAFTKYLGELGQYFPLFWGTVGFLHAKSGYVRENSGGILPDYEKFYMGGINSLRGFDWRDISLRDEAGIRVGGYKYVQFNAEFLFPLIKEAGITGVLFFDTGNVYGKSEDIQWDELRESAGAGIRWYSPMG